MAYIKGWDLSHWKGYVNFATGKAHGIRFSLTKATEGTSYTDSTYRANTDHARAEGMPRGAFHFLRWDCSPEAQAEHFWRVIQSDDLEFAPVVDYEENQNADGVIPTPTNALEILAKFLGRLESLCDRTPIIYTGLGFWLTHGSKAANWARYPLWFAHPDKTPPPVLDPWDDWAIWQYSWVGDEEGNGRVYGASSDGLDLNFTTPEKLEALTGVHIDGGETMDWTKYPIGQIAKTALSMTNPAFKFFVAWAGQEDDVPNPELKPMELKAAQMSALFFGLWDFGITWYSEQSFMADDEHWPPPADDIPLQMAIRAFTSRSPLAVFVRILTYQRRSDGNVENGLWLSRAAGYFCSRLQDWLDRNKPGVKVVLLTSNDFITQHAPNMNDWVSKFHACIDQAAVLPLANGAWPNGEEKPKAYLSMHPDWDFWEYWWKDNSKLMIVNTASPLYQQLPFGGAWVDTVPPSTPGNLTAQVSGSTVMLSWQPATDNVGVMGYGVWRDGTWLNSYPNPGIIDAEVAPGAHTYQVDAYDAAGNHSARAEVTVSVGVPPSDLAALIARVETLETEVAEIRRQAVTGIDIRRALAE